MARSIEFSPEAFNEVTDWIETNVIAARKILDLLAECAETPFEGKGKPKGLKDNLKGH